MRIAVIEHIHSGDYAAYLASLLIEQAQQNNFQVKTWSSSVPASQQLIGEKTVVYIIIESSSGLTLKWWYSIKLPSILKKIKANILIDLNGIASAKIRIPQLIALPQEIFAKQDHLKGANKLSAKQIDQSIAISEKAFAYSNNKLKDLSKEANIKTELIPFSAPSVFRIFEWHEKIMIKAQQADNKEYFIAILEDDAEEVFTLLLRAFSKFKKWQQSSMQLLLIPKFESFAENIQQKHKTYKYRNDVRLIEDLEEVQIASIVASAYALIHVSSSLPQLTILVIALQCALPVISFEDDDVKEYAGDAVLYAKEKTAEALGDILIQLYKDENLHAELKDAAIVKASSLGREECGIKLWSLIETAAHS
jgi:glycosyltransferase involved in cell wall biosynthesis